MIIIAGHLTVPAEQRDSFVRTMQDLVLRGRQADGCIELAVTADTVDPRRILNLEVWRDVDALNRWRSHSNPPDFDLEVLEDHVARYDATDGGPLFP